MILHVKHVSDCSSRPFKSEGKYDISKNASLFLCVVFCKSYLASTKVWALTAYKRELTNDDAVFNIFNLQTIDSFVRTSTKICKKKT